MTLRFVADRLRNRLAGITGPSTATFQYDAAGRRTRKTMNGVTTDFVHDGLNPVTESGPGGTNFLLTGLGVDDFLMRIGPGSTFLFLTDALGSLVATTDGAGVVQSELTYEPFGNTEISAPAPAYRFTGREHDEPLYLYYYRARYYHTDLQRFLSEDPLRIKTGDTNFYAYVGNDPVNFIDPLGLDREKKCGPIPSARPGVNIDDNIRLAEQMSVAAIDPLLGYGEWIGRVWEFGPWDYKRHGGSKDLGNFNYGATGAAMGIPENVLRRFAGVAQIIFGGYDPKNGTPLDLWRSLYGDDPQGAAQIVAGNRYYWCTKGR